MDKRVYFSDIGTAIISKKRNAKNIRLIVHPSKGIIATIPISLSYKTAEDFIYKNIEWIKAQQEKQNKIAENKTNFYPNSIFKTNNISVTFQEDTYDKTKIRCQIENCKVSFFYKTQTDFNSISIQKFIKTCILNALKTEATNYILKRCDELSTATKLKYKSLKIGTGANRLGACNNNNEIILSARLMLYPKHLIDYVILHELSHIVHKNHSENFHAFLDKLCEGKSKQLAKELNSLKLDIIPGDYTYTNKTT